MEINIQDHLTSEEIKEIVIDELRLNIRSLLQNEKNAERILSNLSYAIVYDEIDKTFPNSREYIKNKTLDVIRNSNSYSIFRFKWNTGEAESLGAKYIEEAVKENKSLLVDKVKETIENHDYSSKIWDIFENLGENFMSNIYEIVSIGRNKNKL